MRGERQPKHDLTNKKFGRLTATRFIGFVRTGGDRGAWWECKCDCGKIINVSANKLLKGNTTSCGCSRKKDLIGKRFGRLTVIAMAEKPANKKTTAAHWLCKCDCGNTCVTITNCLVSGAQKSCGCTLLNPSPELIQKRKETLESEKENIIINKAHYPLILRQSPNKNNTSGYRGVSFSKSSKSWSFDFRIGKTRYRKYGFKTPKEAYDAYLAQKEDATETWMETLSDEELKKTKRIEQNRKDNRDEKDNKK